MPSGEEYDAHVAHVAKKAKGAKQQILCTKLDPEERPRHLMKINTVLGVPGVPNNERRIRRPTSKGGILTELERIYEFNFIELF